MFSNTANERIRVKEMRNLQFRLILSAVTLFSILTISLPASAASVKLEQVRQIISAKPGKASTAAFSRLLLASDDVDYDDSDGSDDKDKEKVAAPSQDDQVITTTTTEIVQDEVCDCANPVIETRGGFPKFALLGLAAVPLLFLIPRGKKTPTPTQTVPAGETPTVTPTVTPGETPTITPTVTPTPPEPVPEPMTILLFGTGLASIGMAARKKLGKKDKEKSED